MKFEDDIDPRRITRAMRANVEALSYTADMIEVLVEEAERQLRELQEYVEERGPNIKLGDWRIIKTFLRLSAAQVDIVKNTADEFRDCDLKVTA